MARSTPTDRPQETPGDTARRLIRASDRATLATALSGAEAWPYASLVMIALDHAAQPVLLLSDLADHTKNLKADARASLLIDGTAGLDEPLTGARVSLQGRIVPVEDSALLARYVARHPSASLYAGFTDFRLYRMEVTRAHLVAGFGRIHWIEGADLLFDAAPHAALTAAEAEIVAHMNEDHADAVDLYATRLLGRDGTGWRMTGIDPEGVDLRRAGAGARLDFSDWEEKAASDAQAARAALVRLVKRARTA
ncbi:MAG: DUF2470 domain-containing protein [Oceanibaculum nanhaiense]|uniref:HugZ family pyridoxamine 5'-phosphate oxidase n=1 Tax=Oceanibaculum nanhaiense TaxID=1909734 RepID=UPI0025A35E73|nr:DUF2470 domain-containing protein [Oceanibaculum nanhaiense]MDM7944755.1 DUF2470 domain-containing protein [Oceanibaculum nanhaiense]